LFLSSLNMRFCGCISLTTEGNSPVRTSSQVAVLTEIPCSNDNLAIVKESTGERVNSLPCVMNGNCTQRVETVCQQSSRKRRATDTITIAIQLEAQLSFDGSGVAFDDWSNAQGISH
jgi:molybdopterin-guanine dinucleotide biosynthesis protein A